MEVSIIRNRADLIDAEISLKVQKVNIAIRLEAPTADSMSIKNNYSGDTTRDAVINPPQEEFNSYN